LAESTQDSGGVSAVKEERVNDTNNVTLVGRLTRDAELKYTNSGAAVTKFSIAVNERRKKGEQWEDEANFFDVTLWGKSAEAVTQYLTKGKQIAVTGKLKQNRWEQDGQARSKVEIVAFSVQLLGGGRMGDGEPVREGAKQDYSGRRSGVGDGSRGGGDAFEDDIPL